MKKESERTEQWTAFQHACARASAELFQASAGSEVAVYEDAMALIHECLQEEVVSRAETEQLRATLAILSLAYQQLVSSWNDVQAGRLAAAATQWRPIWEAHEFAMAAAANLDFARAWLDPNRRSTLKPQAARKIVKKWFDESMATAGATWAKRRFDDESQFQPYSHVSAAAASQTAVKPDPTASGFFLAPEGFYSVRSRIAAIYVADLARQLAAAAWVSLMDLVPSTWADDFRQVFDRGNRDLESEFSRICENVGVSEELKDD